MLLSSINARALHELIARLFADQAAVDTDTYLDEHSRPEAIRHHVNVFCWYAQHLPAQGAFLDWGCMHGPDSCMVREVWGDKVELHACDFREATAFRVFRGFARPAYTRLSSAVEIPYPAATFDAVIGSGTLEHVAMDYESLKEIYRVLRPGGLLVVTFLPYRLSWIEWYNRCVRKEAFHRRLYGKTELDRLLKRTGFWPVEIRFHTFVADPVVAPPPGAVRRLLRRFLSPGREVLALLHRLFTPPFRHTTLCCVAKKMTVM
jgi:SAM-dependent methyltransferase